VIRVVVDDLAFVGADAVVRPATGNLEPTTPSLRRLEQVGGEAFWNQLRVAQTLDVGAAVVTQAGDLPAEFVIHAIISNPTEQVSAAGVRRALTSALQRADSWQISRVAIPPVGVGAGNLSLEEAARIMYDVLVGHLNEASFPSEISIVVENEEERAVFESYLRRLPQ
jgi:O-acetyl-ADP-ribose deacetylase (regulator of RNase III)